MLTKQEINKIVKKAKKKHERDKKKALKRQIKDASFSITTDIGNLGEDIACAYLRKLGYGIIDRNYTCKLGEVDIIARKGDDYHFVEVKFRQFVGICLPRDSVTKAKQARVRKTARLYLARNSLFGDVNAIFDIIEIIGNSSNYIVEFIENCF